MKRIVSGITPSGDGSLHIGNYLGAVRQFIEMAKSNECFLFVADFHALTTIQDRGQMQRNVETLIVNELALLQGFLTEEEFGRIIFYRQSDIGLHPELQTILNNYTPLGLIKRAHAYKDKLAKDVMEDDINMGLFSYPVLMAADILMYQADLVPVGKDQKQHVEITRDIAERFNKTYGKKVFALPDAYIPESVATVLGTDGKRKMSKSLGNLISIFEDEAVIEKQVMGCYTDPTRLHATDPGHIEGNMVFTYLEFFGEKEKVEEYKKAYISGTVSDVEVKKYLFSSLMKYFGKARERYRELQSNPEKVKTILKNGAGKARVVAVKTMNDVQAVIGIANKYSFPLKSTNVPSPEGVITINDFSKIDMRVGHVTQAVDVEGSVKLIRLTVDFASEKRTIFTGVRQFGYSASDFQGKQFLFVTNLEPKKMMNEESQGMIIACDSSAGSDQIPKPLFISAEGLPVGAKIR